MIQYPASGLQVMLGMLFFRASCICLCDVTKVTLVGAYPIDSNVKPRHRLKPRLLNVSPPAFT
jgi:hypothetical protein